MPFKSLKSKIEQIANGERIGEMESEEELQKKEETLHENKPKESKEKRNTRIPRKENSHYGERKDSPSKKEKEVKEKKEKKSFFQKKEKSIQQEPTVQSKKEEPRKASELIGVVKSELLEDGYLDVLEILNIKPTTKIDVEMTSNDMDYIEFTQTTPLGFSFEEVTDFIARSKYIYKTYENSIKKRDADVQILASEVKKVEKRMMEQNQEKEMEKMIGGMTEEERLIEENLDLKIKINELTNKLNSPSKEESNIIRELKNKIEILTQENAMLIMDKTKSSTPSLPSMGVQHEEKSSLLPSFDINPTSKPEGISKKGNQDFLSDLLQMGSNNESKDKVDPLDKMIHQMGGEEDYE